MLKYEYCFDIKCLFRMLTVPLNITFLDTGVFTWKIGLSLDITAELH